MKLRYTRRQIIAGTSVLVMGGACGHAHGQTPDDAGGGCWTPPEKVDTLFKKVEAPRSFSIGSEPMQPRSGNAVLDRALARGLATIGKSFGVLPGFAYYREATEPNAQATSEVLLERTDGTVTFGLSLLQMLLARPTPDAAILAVCAHEFGHILSFKNGMIGQLSPNRYQPFRAEQFADFMAGYFAGTRKVLYPNYPAVVFATTQNSFGRAGGDHGSGAQRGEAVERGFVAGFRDRLDINACAQAGLAFSMGRHL